MNEFNQLVELLKRTGLNRLNRDAVFVGLTREFGLEAVGRLVTEENDATFAQTLDGAVKGSRGSTEIYYHVHLTVARVFGSVDEDAFV
jgi:hypothetical protein